MSLGRRQDLKAGWWDAEEPSVCLTPAPIPHPWARGKGRLHSIQQDPEGRDQLRKQWVIRPKPGRRRTCAIQVRIALKCFTEPRPEKTGWQVQFPLCRNYKPPLINLFIFFKGKKAFLFHIFFSLNDSLGQSLVLSWHQGQLRGRKEDPKQQEFVEFRRVWKSARTTRAKKHPAGISQQGFPAQSSLGRWPTRTARPQVVGQVAQTSPKTLFHLSPPQAHEQFSKDAYDWAQLVVAGGWFLLEKHSVGTEGSVTPFILSTETIVCRAFCLRACLCSLFSHGGLLKETQ